MLYQCLTFFNTTHFFSSAATQPIPVPPGVQNPHFPLRDKFRKMPDYKSQSTNPRMITMPRHYHPTSLRQLIKYRTLPSNLMSLFLRGQDSNMTSLSSILAPEILRVESSEPEDCAPSLKRMKVSLSASDSPDDGKMHSKDKRKARWLAGLTHEELLGVAQGAVWQG